MNPETCKIRHEHLLSCVTILLLFPGLGPVSTLGSQIKDLAEFKLTLDLLD